MRVSFPTERLERDVRALLPADVLSQVETLQWEMSGAAPFDAIDIVVPPYMQAGAVLPRLAGVTTRLVQSQSIGYDNVDKILPAGHTFANAASVHETSTAELALALTLASQRRIPVFVRQQDAGEWRSRFTKSLADSRVLIVGFGGVGKAVAARLAPFEVEIVPIASSARIESGYAVHAIDELDALLATADIVILTLPDTPQTHHLMNARTLALLPDDALVVNVGRGPLIDTDALVAELEAGRLRAALDVTDPEPLPQDHPLWHAPGALISPHVGGASRAMQPRIARLVADQIVRMLSGEPPRNVVLST